MGSSSVIDADPERARLAALYSYRIVDTPPETQFDQLVQRLTERCNVSVATLSLVAETRCWFKARIGIETPEMARDLSFCKHAFQSSGIFIMNDARLDPRFSQLPIVSKDGFVFFAVAPLITPRGHHIGNLCILDRQPRELSAIQTAALQQLSREAMDLLERRRVKHSSPAVSQPPVRAVPNGFTGKLLVVDDDDAVRSFVCVATRRLGYQVLDAANGVEALKVLENSPGQIGMVLTDVNMPAMDGLELISALKKQPTVPAIAVMSGRFDPHVRTALLTAGITALLNKPFTTEALRTTLQKATATA